MLRERDDAGLARLLIDRPDLAAEPAPTDISEVAARATTRSSVESALAILDAVELWAAQHAVRSGRLTVDALVEAGLAGRDAERAVSRLLELALIWGDAETRSDLRPVRALVAVLADVPSSPPPPPPPLPPEPAAGHVPGERVESAAAGSAFTCVRRLDVLLEHLDHRPAQLRRDGGLPVRERRELAAALDVPAALAETYIGLGLLTGLLGRASDAGDLLAPTAAFDDWRTLPLADQWSVVVEAWLAAPREPRDLVALVQRAFGEPGEGRVLTAETLLPWLDWQRPRRPAGADRAARILLEQAAELGVTALGAWACFAAPVDVRALDARLPSRSGDVLVQADLTAVAPGPLTADAAADLATLGTVESRGGATVYRLSAESLARARHLGWTADEMLDTLRRRSRTPLPQALEYLVRDLERHAAAKPLATGGHRTGLRGDVVADTAGRPAEGLDARRADQIVSRLRSGVASPAGASYARGGGEALSGSPLATLREAAETGELVWLGFVDPGGRPGERLLQVTSVDDGTVRGTESRSGAGFALAVHRVNAAHIVRAASHTA